MDNTIKFEELTDTYYKVIHKEQYCGRIVLDYVDNQWKFVLGPEAWLSEDETFLIFAKLRSLNNGIS